jgi:predicted phage baseplate assembly protein
MLFELDEALTAIGARLAAIQTFDGFGYSVETAKNDAPGQSFYTFGPLARPGSALMLGFDSPLAFTRQNVDLAVSVATGLGQSQMQTCDVDPTLFPAPGTLAWEFWDGRNWQPLNLLRDDTRAFTRSGHVSFTGPGDLAQRAKVGQIATLLYWLRARLSDGTYETAPRLTLVNTNTASASQALTERDEVLGGSDGSPDQQFQVANQPVLVRDRPYPLPGADGRSVTVTSLRLEVDEGLGWLAWQEVEDFFASGPADPHFTLNRTTGGVAFGDGRHGRIPLGNINNPNSNIVAREYRHGGGAAGNVGAGAITQLQTTLESVQGVTNLEPATGGADEEQLADAKLRAPQALHSKDRAVTAEDFAYLATTTPTANVKRAMALPLTHPRFPGVPIPGVVTVIVVPASDSFPPMPSNTTLQAVCAYLNEHRLLTAELYVVPPSYRLVRIQADLLVKPDADAAQVKLQVERNLTSYFDPLTGGSGSGWDFGGSIYYSEVYRTVLQTDGVLRIQNNQLEIFLDNLPQTFCRDVDIGLGELVYSTGHDISVSYQAKAPA